MVLSPIWELRIFCYKKVIHSIYKLDLYRKEGFQKRENNLQI